MTCVGTLLLLAASRWVPVARGVIGTRPEEGAPRPVGLAPVPVSVPLDAAPDAITTAGGSVQNRPS